MAKKTTELKVETVEQETTPCCRDCKFQVEHACHRYPPQPIILGVQFRSWFPQVELDWFCGEFQKVTA